MTHRDWEHIDLVTRRIWIPEAGGWQYVVAQDTMRSDVIVASFFVPCLKVWIMSGAVSVFLDLDHVTHKRQPVPLSKLEE